MKVYFVGAGPGAADLITVRGAQILARVPMVLYAGSLVSREMLAHCRADVEIIDTAKLNLDEQERHYIRARERAWDVVRLHSGDPSIYGATAEQMRRLDALEIEYEVIPGVSSFVAAAAVLNAELTKPEVAQTIILTRTQRTRFARARKGIPEIARVPPRHALHFPFGSQPAASRGRSSHILFSRNSVCPRSKSHLATGKNPSRHAW